MELEERLRWPEPWPPGDWATRFISIIDDKTARKQFVTIALELQKEVLSAHMNATTKALELMKGAK